MEAANRDGFDVGAHKMNGAGIVAGWISTNNQNRAQTSRIPCAWRGSNAFKLEQFGCDWGEAADINDAGLVLVLAYRGLSPNAIIWRCEDTASRNVEGLTDVIPVSISNSGRVLGNRPLQDGTSVPFFLENGHCRNIFNEFNGSATGMNERGDVIGYSPIDGKYRPWILMENESFYWLPYLHEHWCRPTSITEDRVIVGNGQSDHGSHALLWKMTAGSATSC